MSTKRSSLVEIVIGLISVLIIIVVASPFALGFKINNDYINMIEKIADMMQVDMRVTQYDRGFFSSSAVLEVLIPGTTVVLKFKEKIIHGPLYLGLINQNKSPFVVAVINGEMLPVKGFETIVEQVFSDKAAIMYQSIVDFSGNVDIVEYVPPFNGVIKQDAGEIKIKSSGMTIRTHYSSFDEKISGEGKMASFGLITDDVNVVILNAGFSYSAKTGENDLLIGDSVISLEKLEVNSQGEQFVLNKFTASSIATEVGNLINSQMRFNAYEIYVSNQRIGPVTFNFIIDGLNADALKKIQSIQKELKVKAQQGIPEDQINAMLAGQMFSIVPDLFKQTVIKIAPFSLQSELGKMDAHLDFSVEGLDDTTPADPMFMLTAINLETDFNIDEALMRQLIEWQLSTAELQNTAVKNRRAQKIEANVSMAQKVTENLQGLIDESWLTYADGQYKSKISLQQGEMIINGKAVDPMAQIMSQMAP